MTKKTTKKARPHADDLRGASRLAADATRGVTDVVEAMHRTIAGGPDILGRPLAGPARVVTAVVYGSIRGVTRLVSTGLDAALSRLAPLLGESEPGPERAALLAALNGVVGDYLAETGNPLAIEMRLVHDGRPLELEPDALREALPNVRGGVGGKLLVLAHGSSMNETQWTRLGHDHGAELAASLGYVPVYLRYNSGLHISTNGRQFSELLERLVAAWPVPASELSIVGHSMGGLVARSACHAAEASGARWRGLLRNLVCIGSPHQGAMLEKSGNLLEVLLGVSRYSAPLGRLGRLRSAGVTDMRFGNVVDEDWNGRDRFAPGKDPRGALALPAGVRCYAIAGTRSARPTQPTRAAGRLLGDGLVSVDSALGRHRDPARTLPFPREHRWIAYGTGHLELLSRPEVFETMRAWLST
jgi:pimeloyl-ACP methyl ester carboxylesterase